MGEIERDKLSRREHILNDCIGLTDLLAIGLGMISENSNPKCHENAVTQKQ